MHFVSIITLILTPCILLLIFIRNYLQKLLYYNFLKNYFLNIIYILKKKMVKNAKIIIIVNIKT